MSSAQAIRERRLALGLRDAEIAGPLGLTTQAYANLEEYDEEIESVLSLRQARELARRLQTDIASLMSLPRSGSAIPLPALRKALLAHFNASPGSREAFEDVLDWDLTPFLDAHADWDTVYTLDFLKRLAAAIGLEFRELLAAVEHAYRGAA